jgi:hypothetical protein
LLPATQFSDGDDLVVIALEKGAAAISGSWRATARGHDAAFEGTVSLPLGDPLDFQLLLQLLETKQG